jgi:hypothetical protein
MNADSLTTKHQEQDKNHQLNLEHKIAVIRQVVSNDLLNSHKIRTEVVPKVVHRR